MQYSKNRPASQSGFAWIIERYIWKLSLYLGGACIGRLLPSCRLLVMLTVLVGTIFFKPKPIGWFRSSDCFPLTVPIVYLLFMNHIITGDERNVKNLETKVYISWGMFFKAGQFSSQKVNLKHTLLSAGNGGYAKHIQSKRRIWSGSHPPLAVHRCYANLKHTERRIWSGTLPHGKAPCTLGGGTRGFPLGYNSEAI